LNRFRVKLTYLAGICNTPFHWKEHLPVFIPILINHGQSGGAAQARWMKMGAVPLYLPHVCMKREYFRLTPKIKLISFLKVALGDFTLKITISHKMFCPFDEKRWRKV